MNRYLNFLSIKHDGKGIPYGGTRGKREDGSENYGYQNLKKSPELIDSIPELQEDPELKKLIKSINSPNGSIFSVGCSSGPVSDEHGYRYSGYVEFAINSKPLVADASNYFPIFFHFDHHLHSSKFSGKIKFDWELMSAHFVDIGVGGFTCTVFINTSYLQSSLEASQTWANALETLGIFLSSVTGFTGEKLY
ncbi:MAG: hypothetical protein WA130_18255 [Candidatus Methanoperedens sp.]